MEFDNRQQKNFSQEKSESGSHKLSMVNCRKLELTGVVDVKSFDPEEVILETKQGILTIKGDELKVNKLSIDNGELNIDGTVISITYSSASSLGKKGESLLKRMFK